MDDLLPGDHLVTPRRLYTHHGLYIGAGQVIHYAGNAVPGVPGPIQKVALTEFLGGASLSVRSHLIRKYSRGQSIRRALNRLGESHYCIFANNCEHFVEWCINGDHWSEQVGSGSKAAAGGIATAGTAVGIGTIAASGAVAGLSGSGMMSGLAAVGGAIGGGAVVGLAVLAAVPGALTTIALGCTVFKDNPALEPEERQARHLGIVASGVGTVAATAGGVAAISAMGATAGLSAAGIASGLAALGTSTGAGVVLTALGIGGGAMAGGVAIAVAAPAVVAAAIGYGAYQTYKSLRPESPPPLSSPVSEGDR